MQVYLKGRTLDERDAVIPVLDRGFLFGDGVYEVCRVVHGTLFEAARHFARLDDGLAGLCIQLDPAERAALPGIAARLLGANGHATGEALVYLQVTRGAAPRAHQFPVPPVAPTVFMRTDPFVRPDGKRETGVAAITHPDLRWARCDLKTVNLLPNVLARQAAAVAGAEEALLVRDGLVTEGSISACFAVVDGTVRTHPLGHAILPSVSRAVVVELCGELRLPLREEAVTLAELAGAEECFLAGTTKDVMPIVQVDGRAVGAGVPGPVTRRLAAAFAARLPAAD